MRTIKQYWIKKRNHKTFNEQWDTLVNRIILPITQQVEARTIVQDLVNIQPMEQPLGQIHYINIQHESSEERTFPFWRIKVIFKHKE
jgi:hypothetical protein